jgi:hypothetical protein
VASRGVWSFFKGFSVWFLMGGTVGIYAYGRDWWRGQLHHSLRGKRDIIAEGRTARSCIANLRRHSFLRSPNGLTKRGAMRAQLATPDEETTAARTVQSVLVVLQLQQHAPDFHRLSVREVAHLEISEKPS